MTLLEIEKRKRVMQRSMALGHCICDPRQPCPCDVFKEQGYCHCAGERPRVVDGPVKLTEHVRNAGCASKISKGVLTEVLAGLPEINDPRVLVGASAGDDAGVMMLSKDLATILTVDVFCPSVDDPFTFGQIAAANSLSDVYAMGGTPQVALSIIGYPVHELPLGAMREILRGGLATMAEAGVPVVGGHSINDAEIKCGFAVVGTSPRDTFIRNAGARVGDVLVLSKPLGGGIVAFAHQIGRVDDADMQELGGWMARLNRNAGELMVRHNAHAATDVTGFSLMGHLAEIVRNSNVEVTLDFEAIPLFGRVEELAAADVIPGGVERNRESVDPRMVDLRKLADWQQAVLYCPETSGGMLVLLEASAADAYINEMQQRGEAVVCRIGEVTGERPGGYIRARTAHSHAVATPRGAVAQAPAPPVHAPPVADCCASEAACCAAATPTQSTSPTGLPAPAHADLFKAYTAAVSAPGAIDARSKKLMALALSVMGKCEPCVKINVEAARAVGASDAQIAEAVAMGISFGGSTVAMFYNTMRQKQTT